MTQRTRNELLTNLFQDGQPAGSITPQDARDLIDSLASPHGAVYLNANATATTIVVPGDFAPVAGTWVAAGSPLFMTEGSNGRLTYTGTSSRYFMAAATFSVTAASNNQDARFAFAKNGVVIPAAISRKIGTGADVGALALVSMTTLTQNDYLEVVLTNDTSTANLTVTQADFTAVGYNV